MNEVLFVSEESDKYEARTDRGYVLVARAINESSLWMQSDSTLRVALFLITKANWRGGKFFCRYQRKEMIVHPGEMITSLHSLADDMNSKKKVITISKLRTALRNLTYARFLEDLTPECVKSAKGYTYLRLCKYEVYQDPKNYIDKGLTNESQTNDKGIAYIETYKHINNKSNNIDNQPSADKPKRTKPRFKFPDDLTPSDKLKAFAVKHRCLDLERTIEACRYWHWKKGELVADAESAVRTFILNDEKRIDPSSVKYVAPEDPEGRF